MKEQNLNKPEQQCNIHDVSNCPELWMLEAGGFCQLKFAI
jgi:hypothetical protein